MSLQQKVTKNASQFDAVFPYGLTVLVTNWRSKHLLDRTLLATVTLRRAMRGFKEALNFSLNVNCYIMILKVKNEALDQSFYLKLLHLSLLKFLLDSNSMLLADRAFV